MPSLADDLSAARELIAGGMHPGTAFETVAAGDVARANRMKDSAADEWPIIPFRPDPPILTVLDRAIAAAQKAELPSHAEAMSLICGAAGVTALSYEEAVAVYLRARGILRDGEEMLGAPVPHDWVPVLP